MAPPPELVARINLSSKRLRRAIEAASDSMTIWMDALVRHERREWDPDFAHLLLDDDDREALAARALGRTLAAIDDLPVKESDGD